MKRVAFLLESEGENQREPAWTVSVFTPIQSHEVVFNGFFFFLIFIFIYWFGCAGSLSLHAGSSVFVEACGISFPDQGLNPGPPGVGSVE